MSRRGALSPSGDSEPSITASATHFQTVQKHRDKYKQITKAHMVTVTSVGLDCDVQVISVYYFSFSVCLKFFIKC